MEPGEKLLRIEGKNGRRFIMGWKDKRLELAEKLNAKADQMDARIDEKQAQRKEEAEEAKAKRKGKRAERSELEHILSPVVKGGILSMAAGPIAIGLVILLFVGASIWAGISTFFSWLF